MHLVEILLPLRDNEGHPFGPEALARVREELTTRFGGLTAFTRAPAEGAWREEEGAGVSRDDIVVLEVMAETLDPDWWGAYRRELEERFRQEVVVVRAHAIRRL